jgi:hypothetical protein
MPSYKQTTLHTLRDRRLDGERQAERTLAEALAAERRAETEAARLAAVVADARAAATTARGADTDGGSAQERAADAQARRLYRKRLDDHVHVSIDALESHRVGAFADAIRAREAARAAHVTARQRREVVEKAIAKREAAERRDAERRADADQDDRGRRTR